MPEIIYRIQEMKDRLEREIEKEDFERANKAFAKMNLEGKKPTRYFCSLEKQMKKSTLLDSLFIENKESKLEESFDQKKIEREVQRFFMNLLAKTPTFADKQDTYNFSGKVRLKL